MWAAPSSARPSSKEKYMNTPRTNGASAPLGNSLPPALSTAADLPSTWRDAELDFDSAAELIVRSHANDGAHEDRVVADLRLTAVAPYQGRFAPVPPARDREPLPLRATGFSHLMTRLGAPAAFVRGLPGPVALAVINTLLLQHEDRSPAVLRLRGGEISAIVSEKYAALDPPEFLELLRRALSNAGVLHEARVRGIAVGMVDNMRIVLPNESVAVNPEDVSAIGIDVGSSSFGRASVALTPVVWRLVCSNGARRAERGAALSFRHSGDRARLRACVQDAVPSAIAHARGFLDQWGRAVNYMADNALEQIAALQLSVLEKQNVEAAVLREIGQRELPPRVPLFDLVNGITSGAKLSAPSRRLEIEALAGAILTRHVGGA